MIIYERDHPFIHVKLDGKHVGTIRPDGEGGYQYKVKGTNVLGDSFDTIEEVKQSLQDD